MAEYRKRVSVENLDELNIKLANSFAAVKKDMNAIKDLQRKQSDIIDGFSKRIDSKADVSDIKEIKAERSKFSKDDFVDVGQYKVILARIDSLSKELKSIESEAKAFSKLREELISLEKNDEETDERMSQIAVRISEIESVVDEMSNTREILGKLDQIKATNEKVREIEKKSVSQAYLDKQISEVTQMIAGIKEDLDEVQENSVAKKIFERDMGIVKNKFDGFDEKFDEFFEMNKKQSKAIDARFKENESRFRDNERSFVMKSEYAKGIAKASKAKKVKYEKEHKTGPLHLSSNVAIIVSFAVLLASIVSYFMGYTNIVYILLAAAIGVFIIGIALRIAAIYNE